MRLLHVVRSLDPADGGTAAVVARLAAAQAQLGHELHVVAYETRDPESQRKSLARVPGFERVVVHDLPPPSLAERVAAFEARGSLPALMKVMDAVHLHGVWETLLAAAASVARSQGKRYVVAPHNMLVPYGLARRRWKKRLALALYVRRMLRGAAAFHVLSEEEGAATKLLGLRPPMYVVPNGVFFEEMEPFPPAGSFRDRYPGLQDRPYVLFLGRLHATKGLSYLVEAFRLVVETNARTQLVVAGPDGGARSDFLTAVRRAGLEDRVHLTGPLYGAEKYAAMVDAACYCQPSVSEGFSVATAEALACGTPVVLSEACRFPQDVVREAGRVVPLEPRAIAEALRYILDNPEARQRLGARGRELVAARFSWRHIAAQSMVLYRGVHDERAHSIG